MGLKRERPHYRGEGNVVRGVFADRSNASDQVTFREARQVYETTVFPGMAELSQKRYRQHLDEFEGYLVHVGLDPMLVLAQDVLTWDHLDGFLVYQEEVLPQVRKTRGRPRRNGTLAGTTRNTYASPVLALASFARKRFKIPNLLAGYDLAKVDGGEPRSLTLEETKECYKVAKRRRYGLRDHALFVLAVLTGFRTSEISALKLGDLIGCNLIVGRRKKRKKKIGTSVRREPFPMKHALALVLREYLLVAYPSLEWEEFGDVVQGPRLTGEYKGVPVADLPLFPSSRGDGMKAMKQKEVIAIIEGIIEEATNRHEGAHATRHTFIRLLAERNIPLAYLKALAGHESFASLKPYLRFRVSEVAQALDKYFPLDLLPEEFIEVIGIEAEGEDGEESGD